MKKLSWLYVIFMASFCLIDISVAQSGWFWQNPLPQGNPLLGVSFSDANTGTAVGGNGTILRTTDGGTVSILDQHTPQTLDRFELRQNYSNPFNPKTTISYILMQTTDITLIIYNVLG